MNCNSVVWREVAPAVGGAVVTKGGAWGGGGEVRRGGRGGGEGRGRGRGRGRGEGEGGGGHGQRNRGFLDVGGCDAWGR